MKRSAVIVVVALLLAAGGTIVWWFTHSVDGAAANQTVSQAAADRMDKKLSEIVKKGSSSSRRPLVTTFTEEEVNSYFQYKFAKMPKGVSNVRFTLHKDRVLGRATVDFEQVKASQKKPLNPLLDSLLSGTKPIAAAGTFTSRNGSGTFHLEEVSVGSMGLSGFLLDLLVRHFIQPRYPDAAIDRPFELPQRIDRIVLEEGKVTVYQK